MTSLFTDKRFIVLFSLYMAQGLPTGVFTQALPTILRSYDVSLQAIGLTGFLAIPWALKFLWAPYLDRFHSLKIGRSRSWILPMQVLAIVLLVMVALFNPHTLSTNVGLTQFFALMFLLLYRY